VELVLKEMVTMEQVEALASGRLDVALLRPHAATADFETRCVVHAPFLTYSPMEARYFHDLVAGTFSRAGVHPDFTQYVTQIHTILALVRAGLGAALIPEAAATLRFEGVAFRPLRKLRPAKPVELYMAWKHDNDNPVLAKFLESSRDYCRPLALS
jgi:DNA-binding transcriptional LysR family regulator